MPWGYFQQYVPVAQRRANARQQMDKLRAQGRTIKPIEIEGRTIARSFWGKGWCDHLESFSDFANRLPRGRTYARNGSICHLAIHPGRIEAIVSGSELYDIDIRIDKLPAQTWVGVKERCAGGIGSMLELLQGRLSDEVMAVVTDRDTGLFPKPRQITLDCSCPDYAVMCKHVAAVLYGIGHRLDSQPDLLFTLREMDPQELITADMNLPAPSHDAGDTLADDQLGDIFGIDLDTTDPKGDSPQPEANPAPISPRNPETPPPFKRAKPRATPKRQAKKQAKKKTPRRPDRQRRASPEARDTALPRLRPTGKSVARLRHKLGYSMTDFADHLGVSPATVSRWEATPGRLRLQPTSLKALALVHQQTKDK